MLRKLALVAALSPAMWLPSALALGLGDIDVKSHLNQPFRAVIPLTSLQRTAESDEAERVVVRLADSDEFSKAGLERNDYLSTLAFEVKADDGAPRIVVTSKESAREPFLSFVLDVRGASGRVIREYTVLLDPPAYKEFTEPRAQPVKPATKPAATPAAAPVSKAPVAAPAAAAMSKGEFYETAEEATRRKSEAEAATTPVSAAPAAEVSAPPAAPKPPAAASEPVTPTDKVPTYGPVAAGETLWSIAAKLRTDPKVSMDQILLALFEKNRAAFDGGRIQGVRKGALLKVPTASEFTAVDAATAKERVQQLASGRTAPPMVPRKKTAGKPKLVEHAPKKAVISPAPEARPAPQVPAAKPEPATAPESKPKAEQAPAAAVSKPEAKPAPAAPVSEEKKTAEPGKAAAPAVAAPPVEIQAKPEAPAAPATPPAETAPAATPPTAAEQPAATPAPPAVEKAPVQSTPAPSPEPVASTPPAEPESASVLERYGMPLGAVAVVALLAFLGFRARALKKTALPASAPAKAGKGFDWRFWKKKEKAATLNGAQKAATKPAAKQAPAVVAAAAVPPPSMEDDFEKEFAAAAAAAGPAQPAPESTGTAQLPSFDSTQIIEGGSEKVAKNISADSVDFDVTGKFEAETVKIDLDANDPVSEAEFHLAYGLYDEAALLLKQAAEKNPKRSDIRVKLAETYFRAGKAVEFMEVAEALRPELNDAAWSNIAIMGQQLCPDADLFKAGVGGAPSAVDLAFDEPAAPAPAAEMPAADTEDKPADGRLDFSISDLELPQIEQPETPAPARPSSGNTLEFDLSDFDLAKPATAATPAAAMPAPPASATAGFDLGGFDLAPVKPEAATPAAPSEEIELAEFDLGEFDTDSTAIAGGDETGTKLDLARAYVDMGDNDMARSLLNEVLQQGSPAQKKEAEALIKRLA